MNIESLPQDKLQSLAEMAKTLRELEREKNELEEVLDRISYRIKELSEMRIPECMLEMGITELKLTGGEKLSITRFYSATIPAAVQESVFAWFRANGHDSLIKNRVEGQFGKGEDALVTKLMEQLGPLGFSCKTGIHSMTLKSFVKEQLEAGNAISPGIEVFIGNKAKIS